MNISQGVAAAWVAVVLSAVGSILTMATHYGSTNAQIEDVLRRQDTAEVHAAKRDDQIAELQKQTAAISQNLNDIHDTVHDIQDKVSKRK